MRRLFEILLVLYALFLLFYLISRFLLQVNWGFLLLLHNSAPYLFLPVLIGLVLALSMKAPRLGGIYFLLLLGGVLWFAPFFIPKAQAENADSIRLLTFNFYPHNAQVEAATTWLLAQDADLIFLQDIPQTLPELEAAYPHYEYNPSDNSLVVFSRYPILASNEFQLVDETYQQRLILEIAGQSLVFYHLHLLMPLNEREADFLLLRYDESRRNQQIDELISSANSETVPVLLVGDFNMSEWSPVYQSLASHYQDAFRHVSWGFGVTWPAGESEELPNFLPPLARLDYLWLSPEIEALSVATGIALGSDHLPLMAEFRVKGE